jgi:hypothetical protein
MTVKLPSQELVRAWLDYDQETGMLRWRKEPRPARPLIGKVAGTLRNSGYVFIKLRGFCQMGAHRLAWIYVHGQTIGGAEIDHKDGDPRNNAIENLRLATSSQQKQNRKVQSNNRSGLKGAYYHAAHKGKKWRSQIKVGDQLIFLGYFQSPEEANAAYRSAAVSYFGEFARAA